MRFGVEVLAASEALRPGQAAGDYPLTGSASKLKKLTKAVPPAPLSGEITELVRYMKRVTL
jgi:hypothetical protein